MTIVRDGVDVGKLTEFADFLKKNPGKGNLTLSARAIYRGTVGRSTSVIGTPKLDGTNLDRKSFTLPFGAWKEVEKLAGFQNPEDEIEPVETTLAALAACLNVAISVNAAKENVKFDDLESKVELTVDPRVLFGVEPTNTPCIKGVNTTITVTGKDVTDETRKKIAEFAERSPVHALISGANIVNIQVK
jgi:uncharacterized OsmC-like protein